MFLRFAAAAFFVAIPALAQDCAPPRIVSRVDLGANDTGTKSYVPLTIGGGHKLLLLDTGAEQTQITSEAVDDLRLTTTTSKTWTFTATGAASNLVVVTDVGLGQLTWPAAELAVAPPGSISRYYPYVGLFGADFLSKYDVSLDFAHQKLELFDPNHCPGTPPDWPGRNAVAVPFKLVAGHIELPVVLDGHTILATLDTGAVHATILRPVAEREFALVMGGPDTPAAARTLNNMPGATVWHHTFREIKIGDVTIKDPQFSIIPDLFNQAENDAQAASDAAAAKAGTKPAAPEREEYVMTDILVGMTVVKNLRLYIDYKDRKLYIAQ